MMPGPFHIKPGYIERATPPDPFPDVRAYGHVSQQAVYDRVEQLAVLRGLDTIVDLGCGNADKLAAIATRHEGWAFVGVDSDRENLVRAQEHRIWRSSWIRSNLDRGVDATASWSPWLRLVTDTSIVVCADVVEHLVDPRPLMHALPLMGAAAIVVSTPERDLTWGADHMGPPPNACHVREWNRDEFVSFAESCGLHVEWLLVVPSNDQDDTANAIMLVAH